MTGQPHATGLPGVDEPRVWQRIRRYAVPPVMVAACAEARAAGDWRAACAAGRVDVGFDLAEVARKHGRRQAELVEADLAVFAPDLLRWHLPRTLGGRTSIATGLKFLLSTRTDRFGKADVALVLHGPKTVDGSQRLSLTVQPVASAGAHDLSPVFWSTAHVSGLAAHYGGSAARMPGFTPDGDVLPPEAYATSVDPDDPASLGEVFDRLTMAGDPVGAWAAAGIALDPTTPGDRPNHSARTALARGTVVPFGLAAELACWHDRYENPYAGGVVVPHWYAVLEVRRQPDGTVTATVPPEFSYGGGRLPHLPRPVYDRPADLDLIRHGLLTPAQLHPLVRAALFPAVSAAPVPVGPPDLRVRARVRCRGEWHTVVHGDGRLDLPSHPPEEVAREQALRAFGGPVSGCVAAAEAWHGARGADAEPPRLPRALKELRREVLLRIQHGGWAALAELLDTGLDPLMADGRGGTLLHHMRAVDDPRLVERLVAAGIPIDAPNRRGRTPLHVAVGDVGSVELVRTLLTAGADPHRTDNDDTSVVDLASWKAEMYSYTEDGDEVESVEQVPEQFREPFRIRDLISFWTRDAGKK